MGREERAEKLRVPVRTCSSKTCSTCCSRDLVAMSASPAAICASMRAAKSAVPWSGALAGATCGGVRPRSAAGSTMSSATAESAASIAQRRPGRHVPVTPIRSMLPGHASQQPLTRHGNRSAPGADALGLICIVASGERRAASGDCAASSTAGELLLARGTGSTRQRCTLRGESPRRAPLCARPPHQAAQGADGRHPRRCSHVPPRSRL